MFEREILKDLKAWAERKNRRPLVLRGARQTGKTTVVKMFGESFDNFLILNLENREHRAMFDEELPLQDILSRSFVFNGKTRREGKTLLFIDEIQNSPRAVASLRYFYEDLPQLYVIAAGSLLESLIDVHISFPVGRVEYMAVRPCSFREFLIATDNRPLLQTLADPESTTTFHTSLIRLFNTYTLIGGMPEVVEMWAQENDYLALNNIYEMLITGYRDDVEKYAQNQTAQDVIRYILNEGWAKAGETITLGSFAGSSYKSREVGSAFRTLEKTMLLELVYPTTVTSVPPIRDMKRAPKLIWLDCGLVNYEAHIQKEVFGAMDILDVWRGKLAEQVAAQELLTLTNKVSERRSFWVRGKNGSSAEVDLIYVQDSHIYPIEIKSGHNAHLRSLHSFIDNSDCTTAVRLWSGKFSIETQASAMTRKPFTLINLPFYLIGSLPQIIASVGA